MRQPPSRLRGLAHRQHLGMRGGIAAQLALVPGRGEHLALAHDDRPDRHVVVVGRSLRLAKRQAHEVLIAPEEASIRGHRRTSIAQRLGCTAAQVVRMMRTAQGAWWETLFGTLPSRNRLVPVIPLLPTTIRSALISSATSRIASAGSPSRG